MSERTVVPQTVARLWIFGAVIVLVVAGTASSALYFIIEGQSELASYLSSVASSFATILLVALTGWYTWETRRLVNEEKNRFEQSQKRKELQLRRGLLSELYSMEYFFKIVSDHKHIREEPFNELIEFPSTEVYDDSVSELGLLSQDEADYLSVYYNQLKMVLTGLRVFSQLKSEGEEIPEDVEKVSYSTLVRLNDNWRAAVLELEEHISVDIPESRRNLVRPDPPEHQESRQKEELTETQQKILDVIEERGMAKKDLIARRVQELDEVTVKQNCDTLVEDGHLMCINGVYSVPWNEFE